MLNILLEGHLVGAVLFLKNVPERGGREDVDNKARAHGRGQTDDRVEALAHDGGEEGRAHNEHGKTDAHQPLRHGVGRTRVATPVDHLLHDVARHVESKGEREAQLPKGDGHQPRRMSDSMLLEGCM